MTSPACEPHFLGVSDYFSLGAHNRLKHTKGIYEKYIQAFRKRTRILFGQELENTGNALIHVEETCIHKSRHQVVQSDLCTCKGPGAEHRVSCHDGGGCKKC